ncbi:hypothetical protein B0J13DRAFT_630809 [Dactylonectria estremocensis]|uniref:Uncharacterized protein n=1 Tax=Dactylonectria estremocensis TaxID=1079267 RepID=A0A9P9D8W6_9HYPO|nr:hypothetical protein B0J13DRAFT_630809 [Dactylonectria estremocensis]
MKSRLSGSGLGLAALASFLCTASATTCINPTTAFDQNTLNPGCCTSWITKRDVGAMPVPSLMERNDCPTATCCEGKKTLFNLTPRGSDIQCGSKFITGDQDGDTTGGIQYSFGPCAGAPTKTCLIITVTPVKSGGGCYTLANGISIFIDDESVAPTTNSGGWNFGNAEQGSAPYCTKKTSPSGCQYWYCEFEQSLWESKVKNEGTDGLCGNTISVGVHFGIGSATCTQGNTNLNYGSNFFQYEKIKFTCSENYCGNDGHTLNTKCPPTCCGGQCCDDQLCCNPPSDYNFCPQPQCQYGTGWGWMLPEVDDTTHFVNKLKLCSANRWGEWFNIASLPYTGNLVVGRGGNNVANGAIVGTVSLSADSTTTVKACFDLTRAYAHITSVHVEVSCNPFDSTAYINSKKKAFNVCAPGQWTYKFPPSGCLDWVHSQHDICITGIPKCSGNYYAIFHAAVTKNSDGACSPISTCWTDT